jgi:hypothetical protein
LHQITMAISTMEVQLKMLMEIIVFRDNPCKPLELGRFFSIAERPQRAGTVQKKECCIATVQVAGTPNRGKIVNSLFLNMVFC